MVFAISWSSVASAVQEPIHNMMMFQNSKSQINNSSYHHDRQNLKTNTDSNCHKTVPMQQSLLAHCDLTVVNKISSECSECALWHCQIIVYSLDIYHPQLDALKSEITLATAQSIYKKQYLKGHWQEILRPPKA